MGIVRWTFFSVRMLVIRSFLERVAVTRNSTPNMVNDFRPRQFGDAHRFPGLDVKRSSLAAGSVKLEKRRDRTSRNLADHEVERSSNHERTDNFKPVSLMLVR